ncbi:MAG: hypothetical protein JFR40_12565 [Muribaculaceae bacterium]|jgi:hypothetical protein|nr:hypothetical protein [Muribaculaceae bacterium]
MKIKSVKSGNGEQDVPGVSLRSEKTRKLLGDIPKSLINWGVALTAFFFIALILALCLIPYPYSEGESLLAHIFGYR